MRTHTRTCKSKSRKRGNSCARSTRSISKDQRGVPLHAVTEIEIVNRSIGQRSRRCTPKCRAPAFDRAEHRRQNHRALDAVHLSRAKQPRTGQFGVTLATHLRRVPQQLPTNLAVRRFRRVVPSLLPRFEPRANKLTREAAPPNACSITQLQHPRSSRGTDAAHSPFRASARLRRRAHGEGSSTCDSILLCCLARPPRLPFSAAARARRSSTSRSNPSPPPPLRHRLPAAKPRPRSRRRTVKKRKSKSRPKKTDSGRGRLAALQPGAAPPPGATTCMSRIEPRKCFLSGGATLRPALCGLLGQALSDH